MTTITTIERLTALVLMGAAPLDLLVGPGCRIAVAGIIIAALMEFGTTPRLLRRRPASPRILQASIAIEGHVRAATLHVLAAPIPLFLRPCAQWSVAVHGIVRRDRIWTVGGAASVSCDLLHWNFCVAFVLVLAAPVLLVAGPAPVISAAVKATNVLEAAAIMPVIMAPGVLLLHVSAVVAALPLVLAAPSLLFIRPAIHPSD
jgi:hypothetical protein